jgi:hypothetical protein
MRKNGVVSTSFRRAFDLGKYSPRLIGYQFFMRSFQRKQRDSRCKGLGGREITLEHSGRRYLVTEPGTPMWDGGGVRPESFGSVMVSNVIGWNDCTKEAYESKLEAWTWSSSQSRDRSFGFGKVANIPIPSETRG